MRTSTVFGVKNCEFFKIYGVSARTRGLHQCGHFADRGVSFFSIFFCGRLLWSAPNTHYSDTNKGTVFTKTKLTEIYHRNCIFWIESFGCFVSKALLRLLENGRLGQVGEQKSVCSQTPDKKNRVSLSLLKVNRR